MYNHLVYWEREECRMEGAGMEMEWEGTYITLVMGYGCENHRKRIHRKKQRWTNQDPGGPEHDNQQEEQVLDSGVVHEATFGHIFIKFEIHQFLFNF